MPVAFRHTTACVNKSKHLHSPHIFFNGRRHAVVLTHTPTPGQEFSLCVSPTNFTQPIKSLGWGSAKSRHERGAPPVTYREWHQAPPITGKGG